MYQCELCGRTFQRFKTAGQCPHCGVWASVKCTNCQHVAAADVFIANHDSCPKCGNRVAVPGSTNSKKDDGSGIVFMLLIGLVLADLIAAQIRSTAKSAGITLTPEQSLIALGIFVAVAAGLYLLIKNRRSRARQ